VLISGANFAVVLGTERKTLRNDCRFPALVIYDRSNRCVGRAWVCFTGLVVSDTLQNGSPSSSNSLSERDAPPIRPSVLAIRHGLTQWNADQRWQGWADIPLSAVGERQAEVGATTLAGLLAEDGRPVRIVASDLQRARQTAEFFATELGIEHTEIEIRAGLRERNVGAWSGKTSREINQRWPGMLEAWRNGTITETPEGENEDEFQIRIGEVMAEVVHASASGDHIVVLVSHGGVIRTYERMVGLEPEPVGNVSGRWFGLAAFEDTQTQNTSPDDDGETQLGAQPTMGAVRGFSGVDLLSDDLLARFGKTSGGGERIERTTGNAL
jgi:broad specificity phosphatase PhoE